MVHPANSWCLQSIHTAMRLYKMDLPLRRNNLEPGNVHVGVFDQSTAGRGRFGSVTRTQTRSAFANLSQQMLVMQLWSNRQRWIDTIWGAGGASSSQAGQLIGSARLSRMNMTGTTGFKALASENAFFFASFLPAMSFNHKADFTWFYCKIWSHNQFLLPRHCQGESHPWHNIWHDIMTTSLY